jgi:holo-[acyl-carrier protein] synthase
MPISGGDADGVGIDFVELDRFEAFVIRNQESLGEIFTRRELACADGDGQRVLYLATRWALKEAVLKALGTGWGSEVEWRDVEALGDLFRPRVTLRGGARRMAEGTGAAHAIASAASSGDCVIAMAALVPTGQASIR